MVRESILHYMAHVTCFRSDHCLALHAQRDWASVLSSGEGMYFTLPGACYVFQVGSLLGASCPERLGVCIVQW